MSKHAHRVITRAVDSVLPAVQRHLRGRGRRPATHRQAPARIEMLETRQLLAAISWDGGGDGTSWHDALNWSTDVLPGSSDDVTIDVAGDATVAFTAASGTRSVRSLVLAENLSISGGSLTIGATGYTSTLAGAVTLSGGTLTLGGNWSNTGNFGISGGTLNLGGEFTAIDVGVWNRTGGTVNVTGTLDLEDGSLDLDASRGSWNLKGTIRNGEVLTTAGSILTVTGTSTMDGVALGADVTIDAGRSLNIQNGLTINGTVTVESNASLRAPGAQVLTGDGEIVLNGGIITGTFEEYLTFDENLTVRGWGTIDSCVINAGHIISDVSGKTLSILGALLNDGIVRTQGGSVTLLGENRVDGKMEAIDGDIIAWEFPVSTPNYGTMYATDNGRIYLDYEHGGNLWGSLDAISGTELALSCRPIGQSPVYEMAIDGGAYNTFDGRRLIAGIPGSTFRVRVTSTDSLGGTYIYESDEASVLSVPDQTGSRWLAGFADANGAMTVTFPETVKQVSGSDVSAMWLASAGMVQDGSAPNARYGYRLFRDAYYYDVYQSSIYTFDPSLYAANDLWSYDPGAQQSLSAPYFSIVEVLHPIFVPGPDGSPGNDVPPLKCGPCDCPPGAVNPVLGTVSQDPADLVSNGFGFTFGVASDWTSDGTLLFDDRYGSGTVGDGLPSLLELNRDAVGTRTVRLVFSSRDVRTFERVGTSGSEKDTFRCAGSTDTLVHSGSQFIFESRSGQKITFNDVSGSVQAKGRGQFLSRIDAAGNEAIVTDWTDDGAIEEIRRTMSGVADEESWLFEYGTGDNADKVMGVQLRRSDGSGGWDIVRSVEYVYYTNSDAHGSTGDRKYVIIRDGDLDADIIEQKYYRYYKAGETGGYAHGLKYFFDGPSYERLKQYAEGQSKTVDDIIDTDTMMLSNGLVVGVLHGFATNHYEYDAERRCVSMSSQTAGCSGSCGGVGTTTYEYMTNPNPSSDVASNRNSWYFRTVETLNDGNVNILYANMRGQTLLKLFWNKVDGVTPALQGKVWGTFYQYDTEGRVIMEAPAGALDLPLTATTSWEGVGGLQEQLASTIEQYSDLLHYSDRTADGLVNPDYEFIRDAEGQIELTAYYTQTTASTDSNGISSLSDGDVAGGAAGYEWYRAVQKGELGGRRTVTSLVSNAGVATATLAGHGFAVGDIVIVQGANEAAYNGSFVITGVTADTFSFAVSGSPASPANGNVTVVRPILVGSVDYFQHTGAGVTTFQVASSSEYGNEDQSGKLTTQYSYTWFAGGDSQQAQIVTTTLPVVGTSHNGSGSANSTVVAYDAYGRMVWQKDEAGFLSYVAYDDVTGAVLKFIVDVDTTQSQDFSDLPTGWTTPTGGGLHLITHYESDDQGRIIKEIDPAGRITYTVYNITYTVDNDVVHEVRTYRGWNEATQRPTGPIEIVQEYRGEGYTETLTASTVPTVDAQGRPTGMETIESGDIQSRSRTYLNEGGQTERTTQDSSLSAYLETTYDYERRGRLTRTVSPDGTNRVTFFDGQGNIRQVWQGTDDVPTEDYIPDGIVDWRDFRKWVSSNPTATTGPAGTNMVKVAEYIYDNMQVGDGLPTASIQYVDASTSHTTSMVYDWRGRLTDSRAADGLVTKYSYDNLDRVIMTQTYVDADADWAIDAGELRGQTETLYDERGQVYRTMGYEIDPQTHLPADRITTNYWYDPRGYLVKTADANGLFSKETYDGAGRLAAQRISFDPSESTYEQAISPSGDIVVEKTKYYYDASGNLVTQINYKRWEGNLTSVICLDATNSYASGEVYWYDLANRPTHVANLGHEKTSDAVHYLFDSEGSLIDADADGIPDLAEGLPLEPNTSDDYIVSKTEYDEAGNPWRQIDNAGRITQTDRDMLGRTIRTIENYVDPVTSGSDELRGYWRFDEGSGSTAQDSSGSGNTATLVNESQWGAGKDIGGLVFDGVDDYVQVSDSPTLDGTDELTLSFWVKPTLLDGQARAVLSKRAGMASQQSYSVFFLTGNKLFIDIDGSDNRFTSNTVFSTNTWYHVAVTFDGSLPAEQRVKLYVNGELDKVATEASTAIPNYASDLVFGILNAGYAVKFKGHLDDVRVYGRALDDSEIGSVIAETMDSDKNRITSYEYDGQGRLTRQIAGNRQNIGDDTQQQVTKYLYDSTLNGSLQTNVIYPDSPDTDSSGTDQIKTSYDWQGRMLTSTDQRGVVHTYSYDAVGRLSADTVTDLGSTGQVDGGIRRIAYTYDDQGRVLAVTSYDAISGGNVVNEVVNTYDGWGNVIKSEQAHDGAVTAGTPATQYVYEDGAVGGEAKHIRLAKTIYPDGREVYSNYETQPTGRLNGESEASGGQNPIVNYKYLGMDTIVETARPGVSGGLTLSYGADGTYSGWDRFGRIIRQKWKRNFEVVDGYAYTYDRAGNRTQKINLLNSELTETYIYDDLNRLVGTHRLGDIPGMQPVVGYGYESVAISGSWAALGRPYDRAVDLYQQTSSGWELTQTLVPSDPYESDFGMSVDLDGDALIVGSAENAYIYRRTQSTWVQEAALAVPVVQVLISGDNVMVWIGDSIHAYRHSSGQWTEEQIIDSGVPDIYYGSVSIVGDLMLMADMVRHELWRRDDLGWSLLTSLSCSGIDHESGEALFSGAFDGTTVAVASNQFLYVFRNDTGSGWAQVERVDLQLPEYQTPGVFSVALDGNYIVVQAGEVWDNNIRDTYVYVKGDYGWNQISALPASSAWARWCRPVFDISESAGIAVYDSQAYFFDISRMGQTWSLDALGNWEEVETNGTSQTRTSNAANEITGISGDWVDPAYDAAGNMIIGAKADDETVRQHFAYDAWNRLVSVRADNAGQPGTVVASYAYDGLGRRIEKTPTATAVDDQFSDDGMDVIPDYECGIDRIYATAIDSSGRSVHVGDSVYDAMLLRLNADGSLDTSFGQNGYVFTNGGGSEYIYAVAIDSLDRIVIAGYTTYAGGNFFLARYLENGTLDTTFGGTGKIVLDMGTIDYAYGLAIHNDKIVVAGFASVSTNRDFAVARLNADGSLDTTFDGDGKVYTDLGTNSDTGRAVVVLADGRIVVAGDRNSEDQAVVCYNSDGSLDTSFGNNGILTIDLGSAPEVAKAIAVHDGKIIVGGYSGADFAAVRLNLDGTYDSTFSGDGKARVHLGYSEYAQSMAVDSDGRITMSGYAWTSSTASYDVIVARLTSSGTLDSSFDGDGKMIVSSPGPDYPYATTVQSDGKVLVAGTGGIYDVFVRRHNSDGSVDYSFAVEGTFAPGDLGREADTLMAAAIQPDGKTVVAGYAGAKGILARYDTDGTLDSTFGNDGRVIVDFFSSEAIRDVEVLSNGKILVGGNYGGHFAVVRYNADGTPDTTFSGDGLAYADLGSSEYGYAMVVQSDGRILVAGMSNYNLAAARFNADGSLDTSFDLDGKWSLDLGATEYATSAAIAPDGRIVLAGYSNASSSAYNFVIVRLNADGSLDTTFDGDGIWIGDTGVSISDVLYSVAVQPDGRIVAAGANGGADFYVLRLNPDGSYDTSFDGDGRAITNIRGSEYARAINLLSDGRILVSGYTSSYVDVEAVCYLPDGSLDPNFGDNGKLTINAGGVDRVYGSAVDDSGRWVLVGTKDSRALVISRKLQAREDYYYNENYQTVEIRRYGDGDAYEQYVYDQRYVDAPVMVYRDTNTDGTVDEELYLTQDANFNVTATVDSQWGWVVNRFVYTPYGQRTVFSATWTASTTDFNLGHQGLQLDAETGMYDNRARYYHPTLGRFIQRDPLGYVDGGSLYEYVGGRPTWSLDPSGLRWNDGWLDALPCLWGGCPPEIQDAFDESNSDRTNGTLDGITFGNVNAGHVGGTDYTFDPRQREQARCFSACMGDLMLNTVLPNPTPINIRVFQGDEDMLEMPGWDFLDWAPSFFDSRERYWRREVDSGTRRLRRVRQSNGVELETHDNPQARRNARSSRRLAGLFTSAAFLDQMRECWCKCNSD